jgi:hypothetical protein
MLDVRSKSEAAEAASIISFVVFLLVIFFGAGVFAGGWTVTLAVFGVTALGVGLYVALYVVLRKLLERGLEE